MPSPRLKTTPAVHAFVIDSIPVARQVVDQVRNLWEPTGMDFDDAMQTALLHLCGAARHYDARRGMPSTFVNRVTMRMFYQRLTRMIRKQNGRRVFSGGNFDGHVKANNLPSIHAKKY